MKFCILKSVAHSTLARPPGTAFWLVDNGPLGLRGIYGRDSFNQNSDRSDREKRTTSKGGPVFSKLFWLDRTDPLSFGPKFPGILVEWIAPYITSGYGLRITGYTFFSSIENFSAYQPSLARLYSAAASPAECLRSDGSLAKSWLHTYIHTYIHTLWRLPSRGLFSHNVNYYIILVIKKRKLSSAVKFKIHAK